MKQYGYPVRSSERGFSLIEVLIAVLILGIGLLGAAALQILSMQNINNAELRTQATLHAHELGELARTSAVPGDFQKSGSTDDCSTLSGEMKGWCESMSYTLPGATFVVTWDGVSRELTTQVIWPERMMFLEAKNNSAAGVATSDYTLITRLSQ